MKAGHRTLILEASSRSRREAILAIRLLDNLRNAVYHGYKAAIPSLRGRCGGRRQIRKTKRIIVRRNRKTISRHWFVIAALSTGIALIVGGMSGCGGESPERRGRVVILGFDGVEPTVVDTMLAAGELPNLAGLRRQGSYRRLNTTIPPQSPVAWSSFATCKNPGGHGIFDLMKPDPATYLPEEAFGETTLVSLAADGSVVKPPESFSNRQGRSFWSVADEQGIRSKILNVPFIYPPDRLEHGLMICGLWVPDIRRTANNSFSISEKNDEMRNESGIIHLPLKFEGDVALVDIPGPRDPSEETETSERFYSLMKVKITVNRAEEQITIETQGKTCTLRKGGWSAWIESEFEQTSAYSVHAISRFYLTEVADGVHLYMSCLQFHPRKPYVSFSWPPEYSAELADRYDLYKTIGWAFDTHSVRQDVLPETAFLQDVEWTMAWREQLTLDEIDRGNFDLLISAWTATDRVAHLFWRFRNDGHPLYTPEGAERFGRALEDTYLKMDDIVGKVMEKLSDDDLLLVLSDHGCDTIQLEFNVNTWLVRNGYATLKGQEDRSQAFGNEPFFGDFDWEKTQAYATGLSSVYLNLRGRERDGIVPPEEADALIEEIRQKLMRDLKVPLYGPEEVSLFKAVYTRHEYTGIAADLAPDLILAYRKGVKTMPQSMTGTVSKGMYLRSKDKWSGDHSANDAADMPGILFSNRRFSGEKKPHIIDLGVTALDYLGIKAPPDFEGNGLI